MRDELRALIEPEEPVKVSGSRQLAEYAAGMRQYEAEKAARDEAEAAAAAEAAKPKPLTLVEELRSALEAHNAGNDTPGLNDSRLLTALSSGDGSKSAKEAVAKLLHDHREKRTN